VFSEYMDVWSGSESALFHMSARWHVTFNLNAPSFKCLFLIYIHVLENQTKN